MSIDLPLAADIYLSVLLFCLGACMGSFVTCAADRYVAGGSVLKGRSKCPSCGHELGVIDLIPVFSYLFLRGRCRKCGAKIPARCLGSELAGGLAYLAAYSAFGASFETAECLVLFPVLLAVSLVDYDTMEIPDGLLLFGIAARLLFLLGYADRFDRIVGGLAGAVALGGGIFLLSLVMDLALGRESLGGGDVKLLFVLGLYTGIWRGLLMIILACITGLVFAFSSGKTKKEFPFGPAIAAAAVVTLLAGQPLIDLYLSLMR